MHEWLDPQVTRVTEAFSSSRQPWHIMLSFQSPASEVLSMDNEPSHVIGSLLLLAVLSLALRFLLGGDPTVVPWFFNKSFSVQDNSSGFCYLQLRTMINAVPPHLHPHSQPGLAVFSLAVYLCITFCNFLSSDITF